MTKLVNRKPGGGRGGGRGGKSSSSTRKGGGGDFLPMKRKNQSWKDSFREKFKWKGRAGKAVKARTAVIHPALKPLPKGRDLTPTEVNKMINPVLQPIKAKYSGQGLAKKSVFVNIAAPDFNDTLRELYDEHVEGFSGKSYKKMGNAQDNMLWRQRLKAKVEQEGTAVVKKQNAAKRQRANVITSSRVSEKEEDDFFEADEEGAADDGDDGGGVTGIGAGGVHWKRKDKTTAERNRGQRGGGGGGGEARCRGTAAAGLEPNGAGGGLSRKQKKKAAQMGLTPDAMLALQTSKVKIEVDDNLRNGAIEAYRALQKAKMQQQQQQKRR